MSLYDQHSFARTLRGFGTGQHGDLVTLMWIITHLTVNKVKVSYDDVECPGQVLLR